MRRLIVPISILILLTGFLVFWFSPTQVVKRKTRAIFEVLTLEEGSSFADRQLGAIKLSSLVAPRVSLLTPILDEANGTFSREDVDAGFQSLAKSAKATRFKVVHIHSITLSEPEATVLATVDIMVDFNSYRPVDGAGEATLVWKKLGDQWQLESATWVENAP